DQLVAMKDRHEADVQWCGKEAGTPGSSPAVNSVDKRVPKTSLRGDGRGALLLESAPSVQIFFVGFGDADIDVGRLMAQATGGEYVGSTEADLAALIASLGQYF